MMMTQTLQQIKPRGRAQGRSRIQALEGLTPWMLRLPNSTDGGSTRRTPGLRGALSANPGAFVRNQKQLEGE